jgi:8-oxo-dGTP pyrophosphatase MutT (NUDIX family)
MPAISSCRSANGRHHGGVAESDEQTGRWAVFGERTLYDNPWVRLVKVDVQPPGRERFEHHVVRLQRVAIAVVQDVDRVLMMWRHRFVTDEWGWELPGGIVEADEDGATAAAREVEEETGWRPGPMRHLLTFQPMIGMVDSPHELYAADSAEHIGGPLDEEEAVKIEWIPLDKALSLLEQGEVLGSGSIIALLHLAAMRER